MQRRRRRLRARRLTILEMQRVARFKEATGQLKPAEAETILQTLTQQVARGDIPVGEFESIVETEFEDVMRLCYSQNPPVLLRTADAIHLASPTSQRSFQQTG